MARYEISVNDGSDTIETRTATTPAGARKSLLATVERHGNNQDSVGKHYRRQQAAMWDGQSPIRIPLPAWNMCGGMNIHLDVPCVVAT